MFKQKVSRVLAAFMTLALVVSVMPQGAFVPPKAQAHFGSQFALSSTCTPGGFYDMSYSLSNGGGETAQITLTITSGGTFTGVFAGSPPNGVAPTAGSTSYSQSFGPGGSTGFAFQVNCLAGANTIHFTYPQTDPPVIEVDYAQDDTVTGLVNTAPVVGALSQSTEPHDNTVDQTVTAVELHCTDDVAVSSFTITPNSPYVVNVSSLLGTPTDRYRTFDVVSPDGAPRFINIGFSCIDGGSLSASGSPRVFTFTDIPFSFDLDDSSIKSHFGISSLSLLTKAIITANPGSPSLGILPTDELVDAAEDLDCTVDSSPSGVTVDQSGAPFASPGNPGTPSYGASVSFNDTLFENGTLQISCSMFSGFTTLTKFLSFGSGGGRRRTDTTAPVIEKQGDDGYKISTELKYDFSDSLKLSAAYDYTTQVRACWKVAVGADGKEIPGVSRVSTEASTGGTETASGMGSSGYGLSLGYDWKPDYGLSLGGKYDYDLGDDFNSEGYDYLSGLKYDGFGVGYGLSLGGTYGAGYGSDEQPIEYTDYPVDDGNLPEDTDWKIGVGLGFDYGLGLNPGPSVGYTGDPEVDGYSSAAGGGAALGGGRVGLQF